MARWDIEHREGLRGDAAEAQVRALFGSAGGGGGWSDVLCYAHVPGQARGCWLQGRTPAACASVDGLPQPQSTDLHRTALLPRLPAHPPTHPRTPKQEYLMALPARFRKLAERAAARKAKAVPARVKFSWIFNRDVQA